jgi:hypothetical protein
VATLAAYEFIKPHQSLHGVRGDVFGRVEYISRVERQASGLALPLLHRPWNAELNFSYSIGLQPVNLQTRSDRDHNSMVTVAWRSRSKKCQKIQCQLHASANRTVQCASPLLLTGECVLIVLTHSQDQDHTLISSAKQGVEVYDFFVIMP